jgi:hypothetical protein
VDARFVRAFVAYLVQAADIKFWEPGVSTPGMSFSSRENIRDEKSQPSAERPARVIASQGYAEVNIWDVQTKYPRFSLRFYQ